MDLIWFLIIGIVAGWLAGRLMSGAGYGLIGDLVLGLIGSFVRGWVLGIVGVTAGGLVGRLVSATFGAVLWSLWSACSNALSDGDYIRKPQLPEPLREPDITFFGPDGSFT